MTEIFFCLAGDHTPVTLPGRCLVACWLLYVLAFVTIYQGYLTSFLTVTTIQLPIQNLHDLAAAVSAGKFKICIERFTSFHEALMIADDDDYKTLWNFLERNPDYLSQDYETCVKKVVSEPNVAYLNEVTTLENYQREFCRKNKTLIVLSERFFPGYFVIATRKNSPFTRLFSLE